jgi:hypothetical protein
MARAGKITGEFVANSYTSPPTFTTSSHALLTSFPARLNAGEDTTDFKKLMEAKRAESLMRLGAAAALIISSAASVSAFDAPTRSVICVSIDM